MKASSLIPMCASGQCEMLVCSSLIRLSLRRIRKNGVQRQKSYRGRRITARGALKPIQTQHMHPSTTQITPLCNNHPNSAHPDLFRRQTGWPPSAPPALPISHPPNTHCNNPTPILLPLSILPRPTPTSSLPENTRMRVSETAGVSASFPMRRRHFERLRRQMCFGIILVAVVVRFEDEREVR